jgi:hypothetical protein
MFAAITNYIQTVRAKLFEDRVYIAHVHHVFIVVTLSHEAWPPSEKTLDMAVRLTAKKFNITDAEVRRIYREHDGQFAHTPAMSLLTA